MSIERYLKSKGYDVSNEAGDIVVVVHYNFMKHSKNQIEAYRIRDNLRKLSEDTKRKCHSQSLDENLQN